LAPLRWWQNVSVLAFGAVFGFVLYRSEVIRWERIQAMFRFEEAHMYIVIGTAIAVAAPSMWIIRNRIPKTIAGDPIEVTNPPFHRGVIYGGLLFGVGWSITAACPGPIYAQIAAGEAAALVTFIGAFAGMYMYGRLQQRLPH
jgi:uncharacterized membrane protein YedE/YeeE